MIKKNIYITGFSGQDGKILYKIFKHRVFFIKNHKKILTKKFIFFINLLNKKEIEKIFKHKRPDILVHLASYNPAYNQKDKKLYYDKNMKIAKNLLNAALKFNKKVNFIFANSSQIFKKKSGLVNEKSAFKQSSDYTRFRIDFYNFMKEKRKKLKFKYSNLILFNHDSKFRNKKFLLPRIVSALKNKKINFLKKIIKKDIKGDFSHAVSICDAIKKVIIIDKHIGNIILSSGKITKVNSIISYLCKKNNLTYNFSFPDHKNSKGLIGNNFFARKILNWKPKKNIFEAAQEIYNN